MLELKKSSRAEAFKDFKFWNIHKIFEILRTSQQLFVESCKEETEARQDEANERAQLIKPAFKKWAGGDLVAQSLVIGAHGARSLLVYLINE